MKTFQKTWLNKARCWGVVATGLAVGRLLAALIENDRLEDFV